MTLFKLLGLSSHFPPLVNKVQIDLTSKLIARKLCVALTFRGLFLIHIGPFAHLELSRREQMRFHCRSVSAELRAPSLINSARSYQFLERLGSRLRPTTMKGGLNFREGLTNSIGSLKATTSPKPVTVQSPAHDKRARRCLCLDVAWWREATRSRSMI